MAGIIKNIITLGAAGRIEKAIELYEETCQQYEARYQEMEQIREHTKTDLEAVMQQKIKALQSLKKISIITKNIREKPRELSEEGIQQEDLANLARVEQTITMGEIAASSVKGVASGIATATGAWALVGHIGVASTGTMIGSLTGAAATNATLAWFGGGALAAGGGGMALGTVALGGIFAVPALLVSGIFSHLGANKKIKEIKEKQLEVIDLIDKVESNITVLGVVSRRARELCRSLDKASMVFDLEVDKVFRKIYPVPLFSKFIKIIRNKVFGRGYFSKKDLEHISYLGDLATKLAILIDTKVIEMEMSGNGK